MALLNYFPSDMYLRVCVCVRAYGGLCVYMYVCACVRAGARVCVCFRVPRCHCDVTFHKGFLGDRFVDHGGGGLVCIKPRPALSLWPGVKGTFSRCPGPVLSPGYGCGGHQGPVLHREQQVALGPESLG